MRKIGALVGETSPLEATMVSVLPPRPGQYVLVSWRDGAERRALALVQEVKRLNPFLDEELTDPEHARRIMDLEGWSSAFRARLLIVGELKGGLQFPETPPLPGAEVYEVDEGVLREALGERRDGLVEVGTLLGSRVPVYLDASQIALRHLAVLAVTGAGKSNAVGVILKGITRLGGTAIVLDPHGEYGELGVSLQPAINPLLLSLDELEGFLGLQRRAEIQQYILRRAHQALLERLKEQNVVGDEFDRSVLLKDLDFFKELARLVKGVLEGAESEALAGEESEKIRDAISKKTDSIVGLLLRIENLREELGYLFDPLAPSVVDQIQKGKVNSVSLGGLDQEAADAFAAHLLRSVFVQRRLNQGALRDHPVVIVLEEAHLFCPDGEATRTKRWAARVAREGRKFGVGLVIVSQRPKRLDPDVLSQMNNMVLLRIVEPGDLAHVQSASEALSGELLRYLPSLAPGEAVLIGPMVRVPLLVKFKKLEKKLSGQDLPVLRLWGRKEPPPDAWRGLL